MGCNSNVRRPATWKNAAVIKIPQHAKKEAILLNYY